MGLGAFIVVLTILLALSLLYYQASLKKVNQVLAGPQNQNSIHLRRLPQTYRAVVALTFIPGPGLKIDDFMRAIVYLNGRGPTPLGPALGLEAGAGLTFYPPSPDQIGLFNPDRPASDKSGGILKSLIKHQVLDVLASYGSGPNFRRESAEAALKTLAGQGLSFQTWADRFQGQDNFRLGGGRGAQNERLSYHADITINAGFKYFWLGQTTDLVGQETPVGWSSFCSLYRPDRPLSSGLDVLRALGSHFWTVLAARSDDLERQNRLLGPATLDDGSVIWEYLRFQPSGEEASVGELISPALVDDLLARRGVLLAAPVLRPNGQGRLFSPADEAVLAHLARRREQGDLLVTTATRLLTYLSTTARLKWSFENRSLGPLIRLEKIDDPLKGPRPPRPEDLLGLTFYVPSADRVKIVLSDRELPTQRYLIDHTGQESISLPWPPLTLPDLPADN